MNKLNFIAVFFFLVTSTFLLFPQSVSAQPVTCGDLCPPSDNPSYTIAQCSIVDPSSLYGACASTGQACGYSGEICYCCKDTGVVTCATDFTCTNVLESYCQGYLTFCEMDNGDTGNCCDLPYNTFNCSIAYNGKCSPKLDTETCDETAGYTVDASQCQGQWCDTLTRYTCKQVETCGEVNGKCRPTKCQGGEGNLGNIPPCQVGDVCCVSGSGPGTAKVPIYCNSSGTGTTDSTSGTIFSAIGCIPINNVPAFLEFLYPWAFGMAGGIALLLIGYSGFLIITSGGNYTKLQSGKELLTAAVGGLLLVALSSFIIRVLGGNIFNIFQ